jgi:spore germination protein YaaH/flagellar hook assembly protein FlgD
MRTDVSLAPRLIDRSSDRRRALHSTLVPIIGGLILLAGMAPFAAVDAADPVTSSGSSLIRPTIQYEEAVAHADDHIAFAAGDRVAVPFSPRASDRWSVGGTAPRALPAGRVSGKAMRVALPDGPPAIDPVPAALDGPAAVVDGLPIDAPLVDPAEVGMADLAAAVNPGGLRREVFGFLPYWELTDSSTTLDWEKLSTIAYFGVGATARGDLLRKNSDGSTAVGWSGWTSAKLTSVIDAAHAHHTRVVLTVQSFAWTSSGVTTQKALLGSATARANLARQIAAAVHDRGADGVNLDFEPIASTFADEFTALVRSVRAELNKVAKGYQLTFDSTGWIGNYPIEAATASGGADAVLVMGYDYRAGTSSPVGSVAPIGGPSYDVGDTIAAYVGRVPASKIILGVPYYGRAWSTDSGALHAKNISGTKYGASTTVVYGTAQQYAADNGRRYDPVEGVAWTAYKRQNCTATYGCVSPWRELYYDDAAALGAKYDLVDRYDLRGAGIWALGYDGTRTELYQVLADKFIKDTVPPKVAASSVSSPVVSPNGDGRQDSVTVRVAATGLITYGWLVEPFFDGVPGPAVRSGSVAGTSVAYTWNGLRPDGSTVPDGPYRITVWMADASNNRASVQKLVTLDTKPAVVSSVAAPPAISPDGDGRSDRMTLTMHADAAVSGTVRVLDRKGVTIRSWAMPVGTTRSWVWDGRNSAGKTAHDAPYLFRVDAFDRGGNRTTRDLAIRVDRTIRSLGWTTSAFKPAARQTDRVAFALHRAATVTVAVYHGSSLVRPIWTHRALAAGSYHWAWNGRTASGALAQPGTYTVVLTATSWIGATRRTTNVTVRAP